MTISPRTLLQQALDALENSYLSDELRNYELQAKAIAALREALAAPEPEPVALESVHLTRDTRGMCVVRVNGRIAIRDNGDIIDHMATLEWFAAPPAAPAEDHATPSGGQEAGPQEDRIEAAYWRFDARHKGYSQWKTAPMSERDAFKAEMRNALEAEKVRAEMRLVARGWLRPDTPAAPAPDGWVMVPREPTQAMLDAMQSSGWMPGNYRAMIAAAPAPAAPVPDALAEAVAKAIYWEWRRDAGYVPWVDGGNSLKQDDARKIARAVVSSAAPVVREPQPEPVQRLMRFAGKKRSEVSNPCLTAREAIVIADWMQAHGITGGKP